MRRYQAEFQGLLQYYVLATNVSQFGELQWVMQQPLCRTLEAKHESSARKIARKYQAKVQTEHGPRSCLQVVVERGAGKAPLVAQFGRIPLPRQRLAVLADRVPIMRRTESTELLQRLLAELASVVSLDVLRRGSPHSQAQGPVRHNPTSPVDVGKDDGGTPSQDVRGLRRLSSSHPCWPARRPQDLGRKTSGEPGALKGAHPVRRVPLEKDCGSERYLAGGLPCEPSTAST